MKWMTKIKVKQMELPRWALGWVKRKGVQCLPCCPGHECLGGFKHMEPAVAWLGQHPLWWRQSCQTLLCTRCLLCNKPLHLIFTLILIIHNQFNFLNKPLHKKTEALSGLLLVVTISPSFPLCHKVRRIVPCLKILWDFFSLPQSYNAKFQTSFLNWLDQVIL